MRTHLSAVGRGAAAVAVAALVAARVTGWAELAALGATLAAALVVSGLMTLGRTRFDVDLYLAEHRVRVGHRVTGRVRVRNVSPRRSLSARIELPVGAGQADLDLPSLPAGGEHDELFAIPTSRRAVIVVGPVRSVRGDPLGLVQRRVRWTESEELYVHPRLVSLAGASSGLLRDLEGQATRDLSESDMSFHALRDYMVGDDRRSIHWRSTARRDVLTVKQYEDTRRTLTSLALSTDPRDYADPEEFELAVSVVASIGVQTLREDCELAVLAGAGALRVEAPRRLLDDCAGLTLTLGEDRMAGLGRRIARDAPDCSVAVLVTGSVASEVELRGSARHVPVGTRTLTLSCTLGDALLVRTRGNLSLATLGGLDDLPRALRRATA